MSEPEPRPQRDMAATGERARRGNQPQVKPPTLEDLGVSEKQSHRWQKMAAYARQAKDTELVEWATEIKVRAERRAGELLRDVERAQGNKRAGDKGTMGFQATLAQNDIAPTTAKRWQKLAAVSDERFEQAVRAAKEVAGEVTTAALLRLNAPHVSQNTGESERRAGELLRDMAKNRGGRPSKTNDTVSQVSTLADIGVSPKQSERCEWPSAKG